MSFQWSTLKTQIALKLKDPSHRTYSEALLLDAANDALVAFAASHTGVASTFQLTGDGVTQTFTMPTNTIEDEGSGVFAVHWKDNKWLKEHEYFPGTEWASATSSTTSSPIGYILWPQNQITFPRIPSDGQVVTVYYVGYYDEIVEDGSVITVPRWAREAIKLYSAAVILEPSATKAANLGQYKSRRDAGGPEDNPLLQLSMRYMERYYTILSEHPVPQYNKMHSGGRRG